MNRTQFVEFYCGTRKCAKSTGLTSWYNIKRIRKLQGLDEKIPKNHKWVTAKTTQALKKLNKVPKKNLFATLVGYLRATKATPKKIDKFVEEMTNASTKVKEQYSKQELTETQQKKFVPMKKIRKFYREVRNKADDMGLWRKQAWSPTDRQLAQKVIMLSLHGGTEPPPRLEFASLRYAKDPESVDGNVLYYSRRAWRALVRKGKTATERNPFDIKFGKATARLLNQYTKKIEPGDYVFTTKTGSHMTQNTYGKKLQSFFRARFGKDIGASMLRVIYLSEKHKNIPRLSELRTTAKSMMHSVETALGIYSKKNT